MRQYYFEAGPSKQSWRRIPILNQYQRDYNCIFTLNRSTTAQPEWEGWTCAMKLKGVSLNNE